MDDRARHPLHDPGGRWSLPDQVDNPCNAAHSPTIAEDVVEKSHEMAPGIIGLALADAPKKLGKGRVWQVASD
jgi:hypothetical protein